MGAEPRAPPAARLQDHRGPLGGHHGRRRVVLREERIGIHCAARRRDWRAAGVLGLFDLDGQSVVYNSFTIYLCNNFVLIVCGCDVCVVQRGVRLVRQALMPIVPALPGQYPSVCSPRSRIFMLKGAKKTFRLIPLESAMRVNCIAEF